MPPRLGRGLGALLSESSRAKMAKAQEEQEIKQAAEAAEGQSVPAANGGTVAAAVDAENIVVKIPVDKLKASVYQPRKNFDDESLNELADSIREHGLIEPLLVQKTADDLYEIICGERRYRACKIAGMNEIPCLVREIVKGKAYALALIENIQREDLNPLEQATALSIMLEECGLTQEELAATLGKSRSSITNLLRLNNLTAEVKELVSSGKLDLGHAKVLLGLEGELQSKAAALVVQKEMTVRQTEAFVKAIKERGQEAFSKSKPPKVVGFGDIEKLLKGTIGAVKFKLSGHSTDSGKVTLTFKNKDQLTEILKFFGLTEQAENLVAALKIAAVSGQNDAVEDEDAGAADAPEGQDEALDTADTAVAGEAAGAEDTAADTPAEDAQELTEDTQAVTEAEESAAEVDTASAEAAAGAEEVETAEPENVSAAELAAQGSEVQADIAPEATEVNEEAVADESGTPVQASEDESAVVAEDMAAAEPQTDLSAEPEAESVAQEEVSAESEPAEMAAEMPAEEPIPATADAVAAPGGEENEAQDVTSSAADTDVEAVVEESAEPAGEESAAEDAAADEGEIPAVLEESAVTESEADLESVQEDGAEAAPDAAEELSEPEVAANPETTQSADAEVMPQEDAGVETEAAEEPVGETQLPDDALAAADGTVELPESSADPALVEGTAEQPAGASEVDLALEQLADGVIAES